VGRKKFEFILRGQEVIKGIAGKATSKVCKLKQPPKRLCFIVTLLFVGFRAGPFPNCQQKVQECGCSEYELLYFTSCCKDVMLFHFNVEAMIF